MTPISVKLTKYTITQSDVDAFFVAIPVTWNSPIFGDYVVVWCVEGPRLFYHVGGNHAYLWKLTYGKTPEGFVAFVELQSGVAGDVITINALAMGNSGGF